MQPMITIFIADQMQQLQLLGLQVRLQHLELAIQIGF
jgi:hypothetical protein